MSLLWFLFLLVWGSMMKCSQMSCIHDDIATTHRHQAAFDFTGDDTVSYRHRRDVAAQNLNNTVYQPVRVHVHHAHSVLLSKERRDMVKTAVQQAVRKIRTVLSVTPVTDSLLLPRSSCYLVISRGINKGRCSRMPKGYSGELCLGIFKIPEEHLGGLSLYNGTHPQPVKKVIPPGQGVDNADIILYVVAMATPHCLLKNQSVVGFASHCRVDERGRPIAGLVNFCPSAVMRDTVSQHLLYTTALHEILHVLGFSTKLFDTFLDCKGETCKEGAYIREAEGQYKLIAPNVVRQTRRHFGCHSDKFFGATLQTKGSVVTSHWDSLMMYTSLMTAEAENVMTLQLDHEITNSIIEMSHPVLDPITLAVLEDSGWYKVNFSNADPFLWGKGAGCLFAIPDHCQQNNDYFCSDNSSGCHFLRRDRAVCDAFKTGRPCGVYAPPIPQGSCTQDVAKRNEGSVEVYSKSSRCFLSSISSTSAQNGEEAFVGQCYERRCSENGTVYVRLQGTGWISCPPGQYIQIAGFQGRIQCPDNTDILCVEDPMQSSPPTSAQQGASTLPTKNTARETTSPCCSTHSDSDRNVAARTKPVLCVDSCFCYFSVLCLWLSGWVEKIKV